MTVSREAVIAEARTWDGVRWVHQGRTRHGVDCVGLIVNVCWKLGITDYDFKSYGRVPIGQNFMTHFIEGGGTRILLPDAQPADLMLFRDAVFPCHCGIL